MFTLGLVVTLPLSNFQVLSLGLPLLAGAFLFSSQAHKVTKIIVGRYGPELELNPIARASLAKGTADQDHRVLWLAILALVSFDYFYSQNIWLFLVTGAFGTMFLDWLNDYLALKRKLASGPFPTSST